MQNESFETYQTFAVDGVDYFRTDNGVLYSLDFIQQPFFDREDYSFADITFEAQLVIESNNRNPPLDPKVGMTVVALTRVFLGDRNKILFFSCDTADGRQLARFRKFKTWFALYVGDDYLKLDDQLAMPGTNKEFLFTLLISKHNPNAEAVIQAVFDLTAEIRSQK